jgi:prepilin-type N-terminal cleavage/methylation domain-containing protein
MRKIIESLEVRRRGFTLVEIIIVMVIMAIMTTLGVPQFSTAIAKARSRDAYNNLVLIHAAQQLYAANNGFYFRADNVATINAATGLSLNIVPSGGTTYACNNTVSPSAPTTCAASSSASDNFRGTATLSSSVSQYTRTYTTDNPNCTALAGGPGLGNCH